MLVSAGRPSTTCFIKDVFFWWVILLLGDILSVRIEGVGNGRGVSHDNLSPISKGVNDCGVTSWFFRDTSAVNGICILLLLCLFCDDCIETDDFDSVLN